MWQVDGLPLHPMVVHAPVVLVPLVALGLFVFLLVPAWRRVLGPVVVAVAVTAAVTAVVAVWTGDDLADAIGRPGLDHHRTLGIRTRDLSLVVAAATTATVAYGRRPGARPGVVAAGCVGSAAFALASLAAVALTGHSGADLAWRGRVPTSGTPTSELAAAPVAEPPPTSITGTPTNGTATAEAPSAGADPTAGATAPTPGSAVVDVALGEWALVTSAEAVPPGPVTFRFRNAGTVAHAFRIRTPGSGGDRLEWRSETVPPGGEATLTADLALGRYELDCPVEDAHGEHDAMGMEAVLAVAADAPAPTADATPPAAGSPAAGSNPTPGPTAVDPAGPGPQQVAISGFTFTPQQVRVTVGQAITWVNGDPAPHTATGDGWDTGSLGRGATGTTTFATPGTYTYLCAIHPAMTGVVVVDP